MKKWIAFFLTLALSIGLFVGCGKTYDAETLDEGIKSVTSYMDASLTRGDKRFDDVIATCGDYQLTNSVLQFYFWEQYLNFMSSYGAYAAYFGLDTAQPLSEQASMEEGLNWEQYFLKAALTNFQQNAAIATAAKKAGKEFPAELQSSIDALEDSLLSSAQATGYDTVDAFLESYYGPGATLEAAKEFVRVSGYAGTYYQELCDEMAYTDEELEAYYDKNQESLASSGVSKDDTPTVNVRHILITWEDDDGDGTPTEAEKSAARESAESILMEYEKNPSEDRFAELANEYSTDPGSNSKGGLYEGVYPGQMVTAFNDWCFDPSRQSGDTGIVETEYGYHIMYFVSTAELPYWKQYVLDNGFLLEKLVEQAQFSVNAEKIVLGKALIYEQSEQ